MSDKIMNMICVIGFFIMICLCGVIIYFLVQPDDKMYVYKYIAPENHTCYLITADGICPIYNPDGSIYTE